MIPEAGNVSCALQEPQHLTVPHWWLAVVLSIAAAVHPACPQNVLTLSLSFAN